MTVPTLAGELDLPVKLLNQRSVGVPVQGSNSPTNFYLNVTVLVKADIGDLGYSSDWQDVYAAIPVTMFDASDVLIDVAPGSCWASSNVRRPASSSPTTGAWR